MSEYEKIIDDFCGVRCISCEYHGTKCKRFDERLKPYRPHFKGEQAAINDHLICRDFAPKASSVYIRNNWCGFDKWLEAMRTEYAMVRQYRKISVFLDNDTDTAYEIMIDDFFNGNIWKTDGSLNYVSVRRYKQTRNGSGWTIQHYTRTDWEDVKHEN